MTLESDTTPCAPPVVSAALNEVATTDKYASGIQLFGQGQTADAVYLIIKGLVKMVSVSADGKEVITALRTPGWLIGGDSAILNLPHRASAVTSLGCVLARVAIRPFLHRLRTDMAVAAYVHELQSREIAELTHRELGLRTVSPRGRFARFLCRLLPVLGGNESGSPVEIEIPLKQHEVAQFLAVTPEHFSRVAKQMEREGLIRRSNRSVTVFSPEALLRSAHNW